MPDPAPILSNQQVLQNALAKNILALEKLYAFPRPDGAVDGSANQWTALRKSLLEEQALLYEQILAADSPFEVVSYPG